MSTLRRPRTNPRLPACYREVEEVEGWSCLEDPAVQMVVWRRGLAPELLDFAREVLVREPLAVRVSVPVDAIRGFDPVPEFAREESPESAEAFAADVRELMWSFAEFTGANSVLLKFSRVDEVMCPRFHADYVPVRLLLTYCGPGTLWLADDDIDRDHLGARSMGVPDESSGLLSSGAVIRRVAPLSVAMLKGKNWPGNGARGAVHRSPSLDPAQPRLSLTLDVDD